MEFLSLHVQFSSSRLSELCSHFDLLFFFLSWSFANDSGSVDVNPVSCHWSPVTPINSPCHKNFMTEHPSRRRSNVENTTNQFDRLIRTQWNKDWSFRGADMFADSYLVLRDELNWFCRRSICSCFATWTNCSEKCTHCLENVENDLRKNYNSKQMVEQFLFQSD